ncbi:MAG: glycosyltransferase family 39 protein [Pseudomonadales bacterium]|nr:glycosyltransferase family 39 protein [Pseudomonadales bacterium]
MTNSNLMASLVAIAILLCAAFALQVNLSTGKNLHQDEFYSLERSNGFDKYNDWLAVYSGNTISAKKPPLQYWLNGINMKLGMPDLLALRFWSYISFLLLMITCGWFCYLITDRNPWASVSAMVLIGSSAVLVRLARSGLLDVGMSLLLMAALLFFRLAKDKPWAWIACGLMLGLGALQKAPVGFLFIGIILYILSKRKDEYYRWKELRKNSNFNKGFYLSIILFLSWPIIQTVKFGGNYFSIAFKREMIGRFSPIGDERITKVDFLKWTEWLWNDLFLISIALGIGVLLVLINRRWRDDNFLFALATIVVLIAVGFSLATGKIYSRYLAIFTPILIVIAVKVGSDLSQKWRPSLLVASLVLFTFSFSNVSNAIDHITAKDKVTLIADYASIIDEHVKENEKIVIDKSIMPFGAYGFYGIRTDQFYGYRLDNKRDIRRFKRFLRRQEMGSNLFGLTIKENQQAIEDIAETFTFEEIKEDIVIWRLHLTKAPEEEKKNK